LNENDEYKPFSFSKLDGYQEDKTGEMNVLTGGTDLAGYALVT
jgi:hypothetical protein